MTDRPALYDPADIPIGSPGQPLATGHLAAHSQIKTEIIVNADAIAALPQGCVYSILGGAGGDIGNTTATLVTANVPLVAGRQYRIHGFFNGTVISGAATALNANLVTEFGPSPMLNGGTLAAGMWLNARAFRDARAVTTGLSVVTITVTHAGVGSAARITAQQIGISVDDLGTRMPAVGLADFPDLPTFSEDPDHLPA